MPRIFLAVVIAVAGGAVACGGTEPATPAGEPASAVPAEAGAGSILRVDPSVDALVPTDARIEKLADGFVFLEGPVWLRGESRLLFSDVRGNTIYQWTEADGRLVICEHGNRRISRVEPDGSRSVVVEQYEGKQLNSPNDAVYGSDGSLYFTDPPYGLEGLEASPMREPTWRATSSPRVRGACGSLRPMARTSARS